ncbi:NAD(+) diphosphatase [Sphingomonas sp. ASY06-1R]|uniref:NAD(+) diphosphatase n=1 Tax=Sphingomonas sp. ASY06-1R TaxID=3445771 RepID=UPI003FA2FD4F
MSLYVGFTGSRLDRIEPARQDAQALAALAADPRALILDMPDYVPEVAACALAWRPLTPLPAEELLLLGVIDTIPRFARIDPKAVAARRTPELMSLLDGLSAGEAGTYAAARSVLDWHARHRFCANCGASSVPHHAGWARHCNQCGTEHYPRTDPVAIMLAEYDDGVEKRVLIGRQASFPEGRYSALAGFIEVGESIEEAVARELHEEAGVAATSVRYIASQPWPFPSQLMVACIATVADDVITLDMAELEDARWATRADVAAALADAPDAPFRAPPRYAIANTLFHAWLDEQTSS